MSPTDDDVGQAQDEAEEEPLFYQQRLYPHHKKAVPQ